MDQFLAELYGTNEPEAEDFEKVAHLDFLEKVAEEEGIDLDELSDEDLEDLAEIAAEALEEEEGYEGEEEGYEGEEYEDEEYEDEDLEKEATAKVEEADFLGRVMAHSFNQEMDNIEKDAAGYQVSKLRGAYNTARMRGGRKAKALARKLESLGMRARHAAKGAKGAPGRAAKGVDVRVRRLGERLGAESTMAGQKRGVKGMAGKGFLSRVTSPKGTAQAAAKGRREARMSQRLRGYGAIGAGAAGLGAAGAGAAYAAKRRKEKKSADEQWQDAVQARAWEHLMAVGLADDQGNYVPADQLGKTAADENVEYNLDAAALELLEAEGYPVEWY